MTNTEAIRRDYLQKAHDRGGDWQMAMLMMAEQILLLNDALACAQIASRPDPAMSGPVGVCPKTEKLCERGCRLGQWCPLIPRPS